MAKYGLKTLVTEHSQDLVIGGSGEGAAEIVEFETSNVETYYKYNNSYWIKSDVFPKEMRGRCQFKQSLGTYGRSMFGISINLGGAYFAIELTSKQMPTLDSSSDFELIVSPDAPVDEEYETSYTEYPTLKGFYVKNG